MNNSRVLAIKCDWIFFCSNIWLTLYEVMLVIKSYCIFFLLKHGSWLDLFLLNHCNWLTLHEVQYICSILYSNRWNIAIFHVSGSHCIWRILHMVHTLLWFMVVWYHSILPISLRVTSLALRQSYDCPSASEVTQKNMGYKSKDSTINKQPNWKNHDKTMW